MRILLTTGSNVEGIFSLSPDEKVMGRMSAGGEEGVVGVIGMSSETSDIDVVELMGVLNADVEVRLGVTGSAT